MTGLGRTPSWCRNYGDYGKDCAYEKCMVCDRWNPIERIALKERLAIVEAELEEHKANEASLRDVLNRSLSDWHRANEIIESIPFHPFTLVVKEIEETLALPSPAHEEWLKMKAVCDAVEEWKRTLEATEDVDGTRIRTEGCVNAYADACEGLKKAYEAWRGNGRHE